VSKIDDYRLRLRSLADWEPYLLRESGLPGPRGNLELAQAVAHEGDARRFTRWLRLGPEEAPTGTAQEFLSFCGVLGQGKLVVQGNRAALARLRRLAADPRWRIREAVAMALQTWGDADMPALTSEMTVWAAGNPWLKRAAAAALCEPRLLKPQSRADPVLRILDRITESIQRSRSREGPPWEALRKGMGYCWSVAVVARPDRGLPLMEKWVGSDDPFVTRVMRENLGKARLVRLDADWVREQTARLPSPARRRKPRHPA
jgi:hypothetical protein